MRLLELLKRITGISTPLGGISWNVSEEDRTIAKRILTFLEDRRALMVRYIPIPDETSIGTISNEHARESVHEIRSYLTEELANLPRKSALSEKVRALKNECKRFLDKVEPLLKDESRIGQLFGGMGFIDREFNDALYELKIKAGEYVSKIACEYELEINGDLYYFITPEIDETSLTCRYRSSNMDGQKD